MERYIILSGLPASGKTTLGKKLAERLNIALLDKDDYLEALYDSQSVGDKSWHNF